MKTAILFDTLEIIERGNNYKFTKVMQHCNQIGLDGYELLEVRMEEVGQGIEYQFKSKPIKFRTKFKEFMNQFSKSKRKYN